MAEKISPFLLRDFRAGRVTPETLSTYLAPKNSVKFSQNVNYDEIVGSAKVRAGTTEIGTGQTPGADGFLPMGIYDFSPGSGSGLGSELVTNGTFTGSASGWTLGDGWTYNSNNVLFTTFGSELVTNGTFTGSASGWTLNSGWTYGSNQVATDGTFSTLQQSISLAASKAYQVVFSIGTTNNGNIIVSLNGGGSNQTNVTATTGSHTVIFPSWGPTTPFIIFSPVVTSPSQGTAFVGTLDNVSVKQINQGTLSQNVGSVSNQTYKVTVTAGGSTGFVTVDLGGVNSFVVAAGSTVTQTLIAGGSTLTITPSSLFTSTVDSISVKQVFTELLLAVYNGVTTGTLYAWNGAAWQTSNLTALTNDQKNRFTALGAKAFISNAVDGMASSPDGLTWSTGATNDCIETTDALPNLLFRYKQRLLAAGDPTLPDRVFFSSIIDPTASPFITWNTDPTTGDWIDVNPDDGGNITGFSENSTFCLVFKNTGMYRLDTVSKTVDPDNIFNVGAVSQEAITLCQGVTYFFSGDGIYRTNGGYPELVSRNGVQDIINALDPANWLNVGSGTDGFNVFFSLGQVTLHKNQSNQRILSNVVLKFSVRDQSWSIHTYRDYFGMFTQYNDANGDLMRGASDAGIVQTIDLGVVDITDAIPFYLETQDIEFGDRSHGKSISDKLVVFTDNGLSSSFAAKQDAGDPKDIIMSLNQRVNLGTDVNLNGNWFNFVWSGTSNGNPPIFEGFSIEDITDQGMGSAQGESEAPIVVTELT